MPPELKHIALLKQTRCCKCKCLVQTKAKKTKNLPNLFLLNILNAANADVCYERGLLDGIVLGVAIHLHKDDISLDLICLFLSTRNMPRVTEEEMPLVILFACLSHSSFYCLFNMILTRINLKTLCLCVCLSNHMFCTSNRSCVLLIDDDSHNSCVANRL